MQTLTCQPGLREAATNTHVQCPGPRIALVCIGIGHRQRGYERFFSDLFGSLRDKLDVTLFKGAGECTSRERVPRGLSTVTRLTGLLPLGRIVSATEYGKYRNDCLAYGLCLLPSLLKSEFDIVHVIDYSLARVLQWLRYVFRFRAQIIYCNGCSAPPALCPRVDQVQHVAEPLYRQALAEGVEIERITAIPCGVDTARFRTNQTRHALRRKHDIPDDTFVILAVTAIKRVHKRVDYIINQVSQLRGDFLLWIDGHPEDPAVLELARRRLGDRCRITYVPSEQVGELYGLADVMVHAALVEAFGLALVEAMSTGLPVLTHDSPHFRWLVGDHRFLLDMTKDGALVERLSELMDQDDPAAVRSELRAADIRDRFDWQTLVPRYIDMYRKLATNTKYRGKRTFGSSRQLPERGP